jgi:DEAD/DEAH box helicase domain-containing protein
MRAIETDRTLARMLAHHRRVEASPATFAEPERPLAPALTELLAARSLRLYRHQAEGLDLLRSGHDVCVVTPTASGKTLLFALAVLESIVADPRSHALFVYPTKALAQDQLFGLRDLAGGLGALDPPRFEIYDGDTPAARRKRIKARPPHVLLTNPDMLHRGILAHHQDWAGFLGKLRWVVLDELHVYRGIFGSHVRHVLARLERLAAHHGARPRYVAASATIGNPAEHAASLVGRPFAAVTESGAPRAPLDVAFLNPVAVSPYTAAVRLIAAGVRSGLRTIAFTKARRITELIHTWLVRQEPELRDRIAPYRAGYLPEERRALEARLFRGELDAVVTTSALELGIDVGSLDLCVLVGFPGSLVSSWQRIGRVGRSGRPGAVALVAMPDALDQYVVRHPDQFFSPRFEKAVLDPWNPHVAGRHLECAAAERSLERDEVAGWEARGRSLVDALVDEGRLVEDAGGARWYSPRRSPQRDVHPRSAAEPYAIVDRRGKLLGSIDGVRVQHECHPGAIYLHGGRTFHVVRLDRERRQAVVEPTRADHYTVVLGEKETEILERRAHRSVGSFPVGFGRLKVTVRIREYQKRRLFGGEPISNHPLDLPPIVYETIGFWIELPPELPAAVSARGMHFMGGIHAAEHAILGLFPLLAIADRGDVAGISYTGHAQIGRPAIFVYDGVPGGAGLAEHGYAELESLLGRTHDLVRDCPCEEGCPGCIQSPSCGNGNRPLDREAAKLVLALLTGRTSLDELGVAAAPDPAPVRAVRLAPEPADPRRQGVRRAGNVEIAGSAATGPPPEAAAAANGPPVVAVAAERAQRVVVFDLETQRGADEVGGWGRIDRMGLALAVVYDPARGVYRTYFEADVGRLLADLALADVVVGYNIDGFDLAVLSAYTDLDLGRIRTLDLMQHIGRRLDRKLSLEHLCEVNLGRAKTGDGRQSLEWWKEGRIDLIESYCRMDVEMTHGLWRLGRERGFLLYRDRQERTVRVPVRW